MIFNIILQSTTIRHPNFCWINIHKIPNCYLFGYPALPLPHPKHPPHPRDQEVSRSSCHSFTVPSSLHDASRPGCLGFQVTAFTSCLWARVSVWTKLNDGWSLSATLGSSTNTRTVSSPQAVAMAPVSGHLGGGQIR